MSTETEAAVSVERARRRLDRVTDPELDESVVELGYVDDIAIDGGRITVAFTLPTAWCSPAFAWMMATDMRDELESLPGVTSVRVNLRDHMHAEEITGGVNANRSFPETFPDAEDGVSAVRVTLDRKARLARQHDAVRTLLDAGLTPAQVCSLTDDDLVGDPRTEDDAGDDGGQLAVSLRNDSVRVPVDADPLARYLRKARETGFISAAGEPLFGTPEGDPLTPEAFDRVHDRTRLAKVNMSGQGGVCDALNDARRAKLGREPDADPGRS